MRHLLRTTATRVAAIAYVVVCAACAFVLVGSVAARAADADQERADPVKSPYTLGQTALTGPQGADITLEVTTASGFEPIEILKKVQLKTFDADGSVDDVRNLKDVLAPGGVANVELGMLERGRLIETHILVQADPAARTYQLRGETTTLLRPDLTVEGVYAPSQTLTTRPIDVAAEIEELNGDTPATATVTLRSGSTVLRAATVEVAARGESSVLFEDVALTSPDPTPLSVSVSDVAPAETDVSNDTESLVVDVTEHELVTSNVLVPSLGGYGTQFNQHVYAAITPVPPGSLLDMEAKVKALEPQLVRIFYNYAQETQSPDQMASFVETVGLADETGAAINITFQSAAGAKNNPPLFMGRFADILEDLVRDHGFGNVRWVTVQNEPNTTAVTLEQYEALYRELHAQLLARGLRSQIGLMAGDLVEGGEGGGQRLWFQYMAEHMADIVDAYSVHIYWNYWDIPRMEYRLRDVRKIVTEELPESARKPTFITEFGVRGLRNLPGKPEPPGYWPDGTQIARTNIAAFQQLWFNLVSAQLGFAGTAKWDAYWGKYDAGTQSHWLIGPAAEGWPLFPAYHAMQLLFQTTARGWQALRIDPWAEDDWSSELDDQPEKEIAAYAGPDGALTLMGLDTHARALNGASTETVGYSIGGLPASTTFNLAIWNAAADGENTVAGTLTTTPAGVARFDAPLHAAFALTTVQVA
jgi:hypothetical protein